MVCVTSNASPIVAYLYCSPRSNEAPILAMLREPAASAHQLRVGQSPSIIIRGRGLSPWQHQVPVDLVGQRHHRHPHICPLLQPEEDWEQAVQSKWLLQAGRGRAEVLRGWLFGQHPYFWAPLGTAVMHITAHWNPLQVLQANNQRLSCFKSAFSLFLPRSPARSPARSKQSSGLSSSSQSSNNPASLNSSPDIVLADGMNIFVNKIKEMGVVRFIGTTDFSEGVWIGVELRKPGELISSTLGGGGGGGGGRRGEEEEIQWTK